jgi:hypothetical protein
MRSYAGGRRLRRFDYELVSLASSGIPESTPRCRQTASTTDEFRCAPIERRPTAALQPHRERVRFPVLRTQTVRGILRYSDRLFLLLHADIRSD